MKIDLTEREENKMLNLKENDLSLWDYSINTSKGKVVSSGFKNREEAVKHGIKNLIIIFKSTIK